MTLEDEIEDILYWDVENRLEKMADEESARAMQEWYDSHHCTSDAPQPPAEPQEGKDTTLPTNPPETPPEGE